jgi:hypothetical protein
MRPKIPVYANGPPKVIKKNNYSPQMLKKPCGLSFLTESCVEIKGEMLSLATVHDICPAQA